MIDKDIEAEKPEQRWSTEDSGVVWCDSAEGLLQAVGDGQTRVEVGQCDAASVLEAVSQVASKLESLSLVGCGLDAPALSRLGGVLAVLAPELKGLGVSNNPGVGVPAWAEFWGRVPATVVRWDFGDNELPDSALPELVVALGRDGVSLKELFLDGNCLADVSPLIPLVSASNTLEELDLGDNRLGDAQVLALVDVLPGSAISTLVLGRNPVTDASAVPLARALPRTRVALLHLDTTHITDVTLDALVEVLADTSLEELHVDGTKVGDRGVLSLCEAIPSSKIAMLDCGDNSLSEATVAAIEAALPADTIQ